MTDHATLVRLLSQRSVKQGVFTLASGKQSRWYIDARLTTMSPEGLALIGPLALARLDESGWMVDAVGGLERDVDDGEVDLLLLQEGDRGRRAVGFAGHLEVTLLVEQDRHALARDRMIIDQQDAVLSRRLGNFRLNGRGGCFFLNGCFHGYSQRW